MSLIIVSVMCRTYYEILKPDGYIFASLEFQVLCQNQKKNYGLRLILASANIPGLIP